MGLIDLFGELLEYVGSRVFNRWRLKAEFLGGKYVIIIQEGWSPSVDIWATIRIHNRRGSSTSIYCDSLKAGLDGLTEDFGLPKFQSLGLSAIENQGYLQVGANSTTETSLYSRKYYPQQVPEPYMSAQKIRLFAVLKETFGASTKVEGELECKNIIRR